jgi:hypothetical protein
MIPSTLRHRCIIMSSPVWYWLHLTGRVYIVNEFGVLL